MKNIKFASAIFAISFFLLSCNSSEKESTPFIPQAILNVEIELQHYELKVTSENTGEVLTDVNYTMDNIASLIFAVHDANTGAFYRAFNLPYESFKGLTADGVTKFITPLPFGHYYVTMVVTSETHLESHLLNTLALDYSKAACQVPNEHVFYNTYEVDCMPSGGMLPEYVEENIDFNLKATLDVMTGEFVYMVTETDKIPKGAKFSLVAEVKDSPAAIFLKTGMALSDAQIKDLSLRKYSSKREISNIANLTKSSVVLKVYPLANTHLAESERGNVSIVFKEDAKSDVETFKLEEPIGKREQHTSGYWAWNGLYSGTGHVEEGKPIE